MKAAGTVFTGAAAIGAGHGGAAETSTPNGRSFDVTGFGAKGDGKAVDTPAINRLVQSSFFDRLIFKALAEKRQP